MQNEGGIYDILAWNGEDLSGTVLGLLDIMLVNYELDFYFLFMLDLYFGLWEDDFYEMLDCEILDILVELNIMFQLYLFWYYVYVLISNVFF